MGGQDKGLLLLAGQPMAAHVIRRLRPQVGELLINANRHASAYQRLGFPVVNDDNDHFLGPLAGMLAAIRAANNPYVLSVPCDSPLLPTDYAQRMHDALEREQADLCVAHDGQRLQPVFALLGKTLENNLSAYLEAGERKIDRWFARHRMATVDFSDRAEMFRNINTPEELASLETELVGSYRAAR